MSKARWRFVAALALFVVWIAVLAGMIALEGRRPPDLPAPAPARPALG